jgi:hypothetical protein
LIPHELTTDLNPYPQADSARRTKDIEYGAKESLIGKVFTRDMVRLRRYPRTAQA